MAQSAQLRADNFVSADLRSREVDGKVKPGNEILLDAQLADEEGMPNVLGMHEQLNFPVHRYHKFAGHNVIAGFDFVGGVQPEIVLIAFIDFVGMNGPKLSVGPRIAEVESKLLRLRLNLDGVGLGGREVYVRPSLLSHYAEGEDFRADKDKRSDDRHFRPARKTLQRATFF